MTRMAPPNPELLEELGVLAPPTEDELPYSDGMPMESDRHFLQMSLLIETLRTHWENRAKGFVGGNMFVYFNFDQLKSMDFRGPDFFAVLDAERRERKSWVCWQEGLGPDVVLELLSASTAKADKGEKKRIYERQLKVPEYFWFHPFTGELAGFELHEGRYHPLKPDKDGLLHSKKLELSLVKRPGFYNGVEADWLRWMRADGLILPTGAELARQAQEKAEEAEFRASSERAEREAAELKAQAAELKAQAAELRASGLAARLQAMEEELLRLKGGTR